MVGHLRARGVIRLRRADIHSPVHLGRIDADDFNRQPLRQLKRNIGLARPRRPDQQNRTARCRGNRHYRPRKNKRSRSCSDNLTQVGRP